jgi:uncharacterized protein (DUF1330 family)
MPKGYWIVRLDVTDPEVFARYVSATPAVLGKYGARFLARGGDHESVEGTARSRNTVIEFPSYEAALACYRCAEYQALRELRQSAAVIDLEVVQGYDGPQPG